jgi:hypothetical protein
MRGVGARFVYILRSDSDPRAITSVARQMSTNDSIGTTQDHAVTRGSTVRGRSSCRRNSQMNQRRRALSATSRPAPAARSRSDTSESSTKNPRFARPKKDVRRTAHPSEVGPLTHLQSESLCAGKPESADGRRGPGRPEKLASIHDDSRRNSSRRM